MRRKNDLIQIVCDLYDEKPTAHKTKYIRNCVEHLARSKLWDCMGTSKKSSKCKHKHWWSTFKSRCTVKLNPVGWILYGKCLFKPPKIYGVMQMINVVASTAAVAAWRSCVRMSCLWESNQIRTDASPFISCNPVIYCVCSQQSGRQLLYIVDRKMFRFLSIFALSFVCDNVLRCDSGMSTP